MPKYDSSIEWRTFNQWTILCFIPARDLVNNKTTDAYCIARCSCGLIKRCKLFPIVNGHTKKCKFCSYKIRPYKGLGKAVWNIILRRAIKKNFEITVSCEEAYKIYQKQNGKCALTQLSIDLPKSGNDLINGKTTASLDRIDSKLGYIHGNWQWVHKDVNKMKNIYNQERFVEICRLVTKNYKPIDHHGEE